MMQKPVENNLFAETGREQLIDTSSAVVRKNYQHQRQMRNHQINGLLSKSGIDKIELFTGQNYIQPLMKLFKNRVKK